jgi:hypothetical protein
VCGCHVNSAAEPQKGFLCFFTVPLQLDVSPIRPEKLLFVQLALFIHLNVLKEMQDDSA